MKATMFIELNIKSRLGCYHRLQKKISNMLYDIKQYFLLYSFLIKYKKKHVVIICNSDDLRVVLLNFS